jgi:hypothetical protein
MFALAVVFAALFPGLARAEGSTPTVASGVVVAGVDLSGKTREAAIEAVEAAFVRPLSFHFRTSTWRITPRELWAKAFVGEAVTAALAAQPGARVPLVVQINRWRIRTYVSMLDRRRSRAPRNTRLYLRNLRPIFTKPRNGWSVRQLVMRSVIGHALRYHRRGPIELVVETVWPRITPSASRSSRPRSGASRSWSRPEIPGGTHPTRTGPRASSQFRPARAIPLERGGWVSPRGASASTAPPTRRRSAIRRPTGASACGSRTRNGSSTVSPSARRSSSSAPNPAAGA